MFWGYFGPNQVGVMKRFDATVINTSQYLSWFDLKQLEPNQDKSIDSWFDTALLF